MNYNTRCQLTYKVCVSYLQELIYVSKSDQTGLAVNMGQAYLSIGHNEQRVHDGQDRWDVKVRWGSFRGQQEKTFRILIAANKTMRESRK